MLAGLTGRDYLEQLTLFRDKLIELRTNGTARVVLRSPVTQREIEFKSDSDLAAALTDIERRIADLSGKGGITFTNIRNSKGW